MSTPVEAGQAGWAASPPGPEANRLLASISSDAYARIEREVKLVYLERGATVYHQIGAIEYLYFPTTAIISLFNDTPAGASAEVALVGNDGAAGIWGTLCGARAPFRATVDNEGYAYGISHDAAKAELSRGGSFHRVLMRHLTVRMIMTAGNVVCNGQHSLEQRFCRALLMRLDRNGGGQAHITQETMAQVLGVRRAGVTRAAARLRAAGILTYIRGRVAVTDRQRLLERACECYTVFKDQISQLPRY